jgi:hypothetical protein
MYVYTSLVEAVRVAHIRATLRRRAFALVQHRNGKVQVVEHNTQRHGQVMAVVRACGVRGVLHA